MHDDPIVHGAEEQPEHDRRGSQEGPAAQERSSPPPGVPDVGTDRGEAEIGAGVGHTGEAGSRDPGLPEPEWREPPDPEPPEDEAPTWTSSTTGRLRRTWPSKGTVPTRASSGGSSKATTRRRRLKSRTSSTPDGGRWHVDLMTLRTVAGFWTPWFRFARVAVLLMGGVAVDQESRQVLGFAFSRSSRRGPNSVDVFAFIGTGNQGGQRGIAPHHRGQGTRFLCWQFRSWCRRRRMRPRINATTNPGHPHSLKLVLDFEGARNYDWTGDSTFDEDFKAASHASLESYALAVFEYDSSRRVDDAYFGGACGCGGGADGTHTLTYETNGSYTDNSGYDTTWSNRTVIGRPDGSYVTQYFDEAAQSLHQVITDDVPTANPAPDKWVTKITRSSDGIVTDLSTPANVTGYTHSSGAITTSTSAGLVRTWTLETTGDTKNFVLDQKYKTGTSGSAYYEGSQDYATGTLAKTDVTVVRPVIDDKKEYVNATTSPVAADYNQTTWSPAWFTSTLALKSYTATLPNVTTAKNGSGSAPSLRQAFDEQGRKTWEEDEEGVIASWLYESGRVEKHIRDADTTKTGVGEDFEGITPPFTSDAGAVHRKDTNSFDAQGRLEETTIAEGRVTKTYVSKLKDERLITLRSPKYDSGTPKFYGPVQVTVTNQAGQVEMQGVVELTSNESTSALTAHIDETESDPLLAIDVGTVGQMTTHVYGDSGTQRTETRLYHSVPASGAGSDGTNYDPTLLGYDDSGRQWRRKEPHGTIFRTVYDAIGRVSARWIGTNDSSFDGGEPSGTDDMVKTEETEYDDAADDGNSYVTKRTLYVEDSATDKRDTSFDHDVRGNVLLTTNPTAPHIFVKLDNLGRNIASGSFSSTASIVVGTDDPTTETTNRLALTETLYDQRGRAWKTKRHKIDASDGSDDDNLVSESWFDETGRTIKVDGEQLTKTVYDRLGRVTHQFTLATDNDTVFADSDDVTGDIVLVERQTTYESSNSDEVWMEATISRFHDDRDTGETTGALDTNADSDTLKYTAANLEGRIQITAQWYDNTGRLVDVVRYGTNGVTDFDRDGLSVPARSDTALRTTYVYNTDGTRQSVTDPRDLETCFEYDDAGRQTAVIRNYVDGTPSSSTGDDDVYTRYEYTDGLRTKLWVDFDGDNTVDTGDQDTIYTYGTTQGASAGDSEIGSGHLLQKVQYPDSSGGTDVVTYAYNAQSERIYTKDQVGYVLEMDFDDSGRLEHRRATNTGSVSGFDEDILRITTSYDSLGRREKITQYDNATVGSGTVQDEVKYTYDGWGNLEKIEQDNNSAVVASGDEYSITYAFEKNTTGRNTIRRTTMTAPSGNVFEYKYRDIAGRHDDDCSRVTHINDGATLLALYDYNGQSQVVGTDYTGIDVMRQLWGSTSGDYPAFDRFDRVVEDRWVKDLSTDQAIYDIDLTYDRNSNITSLDDHVHAGFDVDYTIDNLDRLTRAQEGTLSGATITSETRDQEWTLTQTGNWDPAKLDLNGDGDWDETDEYNDDRTHNDANELTARDTNDDETDDFTLTYDAAGNLTDDGESYKYEYDVLYRLRKVNNQSDALVAEYQYGGLGHRIAEHTDTDNDGDVDSNDDWHHFVYDERWRVVAMYVDTDTTPTEEFMHHAAGDSGYGGASYIDEVGIRDRDTDANGSLDERVFYCQNWRHDVVCLVGANGDQLEMVRYSAYGVPFGLPAGDADSDGDCDSGDTVDTDQIQTWIDASSYDVRGDLDLDGDVDASDKSSAPPAVASGRGVLSENANVLGQAGRPWSSHAYETRHRSLRADLGRWNRRDPLGYRDGTNTYLALLGSPLGWVDPDGRSASAWSFCGAFHREFDIHVIPKDFCQDKHGGPPPADGGGVGYMVVMKTDFFQGWLGCNVIGDFQNGQSPGGFETYALFEAFPGNDSESKRIADLVGSPGVIPSLIGAGSRKKKVKVYCYNRPVIQDIPSLMFEINGWRRNKREFEDAGHSTTDWPSWTQPGVWNIPGDWEGGLNIQWSWGDCCTTLSPTVLDWQVY